MVCLIIFENINFGLQCSCIRTAATCGLGQFGLGQGGGGGGGGGRKGLSAILYSSSEHLYIQFNTEAALTTKEVVKG